MKIVKKIGIAAIALICSASSFADPDIIIVGAGPVGLATAVQIALYTKDTGVKILLLEKHESYQRTNSISLSEESFVKSHTDESYSNTWKAWGSSVAVTKVENDLLTLAADLGIEIRRPYTVESLKQVREEYPLTEVVIAADGSRSVLRQHFVSDKNTHRQDLQYLARVTYKVEGKTRALKLWTEATPLLGSVHHIVTESLRTTPDGKTQVTLDVIVSEKEFKALKKHATFKNPVHWDSDREKGLVPVNLVKTIDRWIAERVGRLEENVVPMSMQLSCTDLVTYASPRVVFNEGNLTVYVVGDAAFGVPYLRSGNNGFMCANNLAKVVARRFVKNLHTRTMLPHGVTTPIGALSFVVQSVMPMQNDNDYQNFVMQLQTREKVLAHLKATGLSLLTAPVRLLQVKSRSAVCEPVDPNIVWEDAIAQETREDEAPQEDARVALENEPATQVPNLDEMPLVDTPEDSDESGYEADGADADVRASLFESSIVGNGA